MASASAGRAASGGRWRLRDLTRVQPRMIALTLFPAPARAWLMPGGTIRLDTDRWNRDYAEGYERALDDLAELSRYSIVAGYCRALGKRSVLDIGCGTGLLLKHIGPFGYADYTGLDLSDVAIAEANRAAPEGARFVLGRAETYEPGRRFDVVVLNEILYYLEEPEALLRRCAGFLEPDGALIVSLYEMSQSWRSWWRCADTVVVEDEVLVRRRADLAWRVRLCRPAQPA